MLQRGYYYNNDLDEVIFVSGKKTGNYYYNQWADELRWAGIMLSNLENNPPSGEPKINPPKDVPRAPGDKV